MKLVYTLCASILLLAACSNGQLAVPQENAAGNHLEDHNGGQGKTESTTGPEDGSVSDQDDADSGLKDAARAAVTALADRNMKNLAKHAHPDKGVRISPYAHIDAEQDQVFQADQLADLLDDQTEYIWGYQDGSGKPITMTFKGYFDLFIYDKDFVNAKQISYGSLIGTGNTPSNIDEVYPGSRTVEYYFPGSDANGHDWKSLRLVFEQQDGQWYLVGIVHAQWTI